MPDRQHRELLFWKCLIQLFILQVKGKKWGFDDQKEGQEALNVQLNDDYSHLSRTLRRLLGALLRSGGARGGDVGLEIEIYGDAGPLKIEYQDSFRFFVWFTPVRSIWTKDDECQKFGEHDLQMNIVQSKWNTFCLAISALRAAASTLPSTRSRRREERTKRTPWKGEMNVIKKNKRKLMKHVIC